MKRSIKSVLVIGSGPIVIGQACEFDYSGTQALKALRARGVRTVLINPNPATIMTDPGLADRTYLEPLTLESLDRVLAAERVDAVLPTMGGQTALNLAVAAHAKGVLRRRGARLIGASAKAIEYAEDRLAFRRRMARFGLPLPRGFCVSSVAELKSAGRRLGYPVLMRSSFTLGGLGSGVARDEAKLVELYQQVVRVSPSPVAVVEEFLQGWQEFELEVVRDRADNCVVVCPMENVDPMGVHTGDSVTVAPIQTLTDSEYQALRQMAFSCVRAVGVDTGGANVQFARDPSSGRTLLIEMNPRVSRSSALASKATGYPIASVAAELALGHTLDELGNGITGQGSAAFEPSIDYVVVKIPTFQFAKFNQKDPWLTTSMKSVGEAMAIGRSFPEALQKGWRSLEEGYSGLHSGALAGAPLASVLERVARPNPSRLLYIKEALRRGQACARLEALSRIHGWFIRQIGRIVEAERRLSRGLSRETLAGAKLLGFSDHRVAELTRRPAAEVERRGRAWRIGRAFYEVDTCAGEFPAKTPYFYSTYQHGALPPAARRGRRKRRYVVLGAGPNRIGEGLEFDYSCVHAAQAIREAGGEAVIINSNPETVSTDHDISTRLYFEPVHLEDVTAVLRHERPDGVLLQFGGQTPLNLATALARGGWPILGTSVESIVRSEDRVDFARALRQLGLPYPRFAVADHRGEVMARAEEIGMPILVRPSFVMGGDRIRIFRDKESLAAFVDEYPEDSGRFLIDRFLSPASEVDVDGVADGKDVRLCGVLEHVELAGIHSGDSSMMYPTVNLSAEILAKIEDYTRQLALHFQVRGLFNVQLAVHLGQPYLIELNARASRTVPFLSKATGIPWAKVATRVLLGDNLRAALKRYAPARRAGPRLYFAKSSAFCFYRFPGPEPALGPEMRSTGETMGIAPTPQEALAKARVAAGQQAMARFGQAYCLQQLDGARRRRAA